MCLGELKATCRALWPRDIGSYSLNKPIKMRARVMGHDSENRRQSSPKTLTTNKLADKVCQFAAVTIHF